MKSMDLCLQIDTAHQKKYSTNMNANDSNNEVLSMPFQDDFYSIETEATNESSTEPSGESSVKLSESSTESSNESSGGSSSESSDKSTDESSVESSASAAPVYLSEFEDISSDSYSEEEIHAELVYAECLLLKVSYGLFLSWLTLI